MSEDEMSSSPCMWQWSLFLRLVLSLSVFTWLAPLSTDQSQVGRTVSFVIAKLGQRTLVAYVAHWTILFSIVGFPAAVGALGAVTAAYGQLAGLVVLLGTAAAFCSPMAEWLFGW